MNLEQEKTNRGPAVEECASGTSVETFHPFRWLHQAQNRFLDLTTGNITRVPPYAQTYARIPFTLCLPYVSHTAEAALELRTHLLSFWFVKTRRNSVFSGI